LQSRQVPATAPLWSSAVPDLNGFVLSPAYQACSDTNDIYWQGFPLFDILQRVISLALASLVHLALIAIEQGLGL